MRVVAYLRVSTDRQAEEGLGLELQEQAIQRWARDEGHRIIETFRDEGVSGSNGLGMRRGLPDALELLHLGKADGVVVYRLDRLARDLILQEQLLADVWRLGCKVYSTSRAEDDYLSDDPNDPSRKLIRQVLGAVSEYERAMIALRLRAGRLRKVERGGYGGGRPPFGYRAEGRSLVPDPKEQLVLARMLDLRKRGISTNEIASLLNTDGLLAKSGGKWHAASVWRVLNGGRMAADAETDVTAV